MHSPSLKFPVSPITGAFFVTGKNLDKKAGIESIEDETAQAESDAEEITKTRKCRFTAAG